jgi:hypothetical protein
MTPATARLLDSAADAYNPLLTLLALGAPWLPPRRRWPAALRYYAAAAAGIAVVYLVMAADNRFDLWGSLGLDYSTHFAFATSLVVSMALLRPRWTMPLALSLLGYFVLILVLRYHGALDLLSAALVVLPFPWLGHRWLLARLEPA